MLTTKLSLFTTFVFFMVLSFSNMVSSNPTTFLDWNSGELQALEGWDWFDDVAYGNPGWVLSPNSSVLGGGGSFAWGPGPRSFNKGDYGKDNTAYIDTLDRAPSTETGSSLKVIETENSTDHRSTWWLWYDGKPLIERGITDNNTDRMSLYLKTTGMQPLDENPGKDSVATNFHIATYLCWDTDAPAYGAGDGCPYEGPGNQHYYHYLSIDPGAWLHVLLDQHPQHLRGVGQVSNNLVSNVGKNYFAQMHQFYAEIIREQPQKTSYNIDEILFYSTKDTIEPNQNDISISSVWVGYWPASDEWQIGFHDTSFEKYSDYTFSTFEIRWSKTPITNSNFLAATLIDPLIFGGADYVGESSSGLIRKPNPWKQQLRTKFKLPAESVNGTNKIYFAIKDVSKLGEHIGVRWPWNKGDGHDAPSEFIKLIDYSLSGVKQSLAKPPVSFKANKVGT